MIKCLLATSALALVGGFGCHKTMSAKVTQPNPLVEPSETLRDSMPIVIVTGDMELQAPRGPKPGEATTLLVNDRYPLHNIAQFTVVSRDRLRFHVQIEHKWQDYADVSTWHATLVDDRGRRYVPVAVESPREGHVVMMWDYETRSVVRDRFGDIVHIRRDGHMRRRTLGSLSVFRGRGDYVFYSRDLFSSDVKSLTLQVSRRGYTFEFTWQFQDDEAMTEPVMANKPGGSGQAMGLTQPATTH